MQTYVDEKLGGDGGRIQLVNDDGTLKLQLSFPFKKAFDLAVRRIREPAIELIKKVIPGERFDGYAVNVVDGVLGLIGNKAKPEAEVVISPAAAVAPKA